MLTWKYSEKNFVCRDKHGRTLTLIRGEDGGILFQAGSEKFFVDPGDIAKVVFQKPQLFKAGTIAFFDDDDEVLQYVCDGRQISLLVDVSKEYKDTFYFMFSIFKDNGFEVSVL